MPRISEEEQHEITAQHLRGDMSVEVWLIPFSLTISIVVIVIVAMIVLHVLKQKRRNAEQQEDYHPANTGESDEMLTFSPAVMISDENIANGSMTGNEEIEDDQQSNVPRKHEWPSETESKQTEWSGLPSSNL